MSYQIAKLVARIAENLPEMSSDIMQGWIDNPKGLQKFLLSLCPPNDFPIWKTIKLGTGFKTADDFRKAIKDCGMKIGDWANDILGKPEFVVTTEGTKVDLVKVTVAELGFKKGARRDQIYDRAKELGLELCPPEVGPQLRMQYKDQPNGEWILIGMEPLRFSGGYLDVFRVGRHDSGLWLYGLCTHPDGVWRADDQWVFVRPSQVSKSVLGNLES